MNHIHHTIAILLTVLLAAAASAQQRRVPPVFQPIEDEPNLPRVLLIGDSISMGYTLPVRDMLKGKANVHRPPTNCGPTTRGLEQVDNWLGEGKWDVIHFNWGLHDLKYMNEKGGLVDPAEGRIQVPIEQYETNLRKLVQRMKQTGATLIWCSTTPVPEGSLGRIKGDAAKYNKVAARVTKEQGVATNDLYTFAFKRLEKIQRPKNVHFTPEGSKQLAERVSEVIAGALKKGDD